MKDLKKIILSEDLEYKELEDGTLMIQKKERAPFALELGKDYVSEDGRTIVIDRKGDRWNNGFHTKRSIESRRCLSTSIRCSKPSYWKEATEEQVKEAFEEELVARYGEDWENIQLKNNIDPNTVKGFNSKTYTPKIIKNYRRGWDVWNKNGLLYYDGKWAEVIEEPKYAEKLEDIDRPWITSGDGDVYYFTGQDVNQFTTKERAEQVLALIQLIAFRDDIWAKGGYGKIYGISNNNGKFKASDEIRGIFSFKDKETCEYFIEKHRDLLEIYSGIVEK